MMRMGYAAQLETPLRRLLFWLWDVSPLFPGHDQAERLVAWLGCALYGHSPYIEMDNRTVRCAFCHRVTGYSASNGEVWPP